MPHQGGSNAVQMVCHMSEIAKIFLVRQKGLEGSAKRLMCIWTQKMQISTVFCADYNALSSLIRGANLRYETIKIKIEKGPR